MYQEVEEVFWGSLSCTGEYYEPRYFDEAIALECYLAPFEYKEKELLVF